MSSLLLFQLKHSVRRIRQAPVFTLTAVSLLALGLMATVGFITLIQTILLAPLPYEEPDRLYGLRSVQEARGERVDLVSIGDFGDLSRTQTSFSALAAFRGDFLNYQGTFQSERGTVTTQQWAGARVTADFLNVLDVSPLAGRTFQPDDFSASASPVIILSEQVWERVFARDPNVIGQAIIISGSPVQVVGVLPRIVREPSFAEAWMPFPDGSVEYFVRDSRYWSAVGRLAEDVSPAQAQVELAQLAAGLAEAYPADNTGWTILPVPLLEMRISGIRPALWLGSLASGLLLLVTTLNLANLLLARATRRQREVAVRRALGASGGTVAREVALEGFLLAVLGALAAAGLLQLFIKEIIPSLPEQFLPRGGEVQFSWVTWAQLGGATVAVAVLCSLWPALAARRTNLLGALQEGASYSATDRGAARVHGILVTAQLALTLMIAAAAWIVTAQWQALRQTPLGFEPGEVIAFTIAPPEDMITGFSDLSRYYGELLREVRAEPAVAQAEMTVFPPLFGFSFNYSIDFPAHQPPVDVETKAIYQSITPGFFDLLAVPLVAGRPFDERDAQGTSPTVIVNEAFAQRFFPGTSPLGHTLEVLPWMGLGPRTIVGVVGTYKNDSLTETPTPQLFVPQEQSPWMFGQLLIEGRPGSAITPLVEQALRRHDPSLGVTATTLSIYRDRQTANEAAMSALMLAFAATALSLALFGVYALLTLLVTAQRREIGVRMALGADATRILRHFLGNGARQLLVGLLVGVALAWAAFRIVQATLPAIGDGSFLALLGAASALFVAGLLATVGPALRAARVNPNEALRQ